ncbi:MAG: hypothetical protein IK085_01055 [Clostridia bacterium]|nr:hypothetical protein [Clostridia bacterium]
MFFVFDGGSTREIENLPSDSSSLTAGYVSVDELEALCPQLCFSESTVECCRVAASGFRSGVEIHDDYTFTELRIISADRKPDDCVALYIKKNMFLVVNVDDNDGSIMQRFLAAVRRYPASAVTLEKLIFAFFDKILSGDVKAIEETVTRLTELEYMIFNDEADDSFIADLLGIKKDLLRQHNYYEQILDITEAIEENENDIFINDDLIYISNISKKVERLREDSDSCKNTVEHLQSAYTSRLDARLNSTMKTLTVLTSIFFPLTIIVGWYGMNFESMPEFKWRYGYLFVILLSVAISLVMVLVGKKKKW